MSAPFLLYIDVHVLIVVTESLRRRGLEILTSQDDGSATQDDENHLASATELGRMLFSQDLDFPRIASDWEHVGRAFAGVVFAAQQGVSLDRNADDLLTACRIAALRRETQGAWLRHGGEWSGTSSQYTLYCHAQAPNGRVVDCQRPAEVVFAMATVRSAHPGGVNLLMGDGSTRFVADCVSLAVWRGFGTRNGRELVD